MNVFEFNWFCLAGRFLFLFCGLRWMEVDPALTGGACAGMTRFGCESGFWGVECKCLLARGIRHTGTDFVFMEHLRFVRVGRRFNK